MDRTAEAALTIAISPAKLFSSHLSSDRLFYRTRRIARDARICQESESHHRHDSGVVGRIHHLRELPAESRRLLPSSVRCDHTVQAFIGDHRRCYLRSTRDVDNSVLVATTLERHIFGSLAKFAGAGACAKEQH